MAEFCQILMVCFMEFTNIEPVYIKELAEGAQGGMGGDKSLNNEVR